MSMCPCVGSADDKRSKDIDRGMKKEELSHESEYKLLLLGAGESGKSTIFKQMKIIHQKGYSDDERRSFIAIVHSNAINCIKILVEAAENFEYDLSGEYAPMVERVQSLTVDNKVTPQLAAEFSKLWQTESIQSTYKRASEYQLPDSAAYFLNDIDRFTRPDYLPTDQDVLRSRVRTTGIVETSWMVEQVTFKMFDVGGQRNERRKWIHCFDNVTAVIFVAALSEYDQMLFEDESQNRMLEAMNLFEQISNSRWFHNTAMILLLNKLDLFQEKIRIVNLNVCFPDFKGPAGNEDAALGYITEKFRSLNRCLNRGFYIHKTCATDTTLVKKLFEDIKDTVMNKNLDVCGF